MRALLLALSLFACSDPAPAPPPPASAGAPPETRPAPTPGWQLGVFLGEGRERLALLPDGTMILPPLMGTFTLDKEALSFTPSGASTLRGTLRPEPDGLSLSLDGRTLRLRRATGFTSYPRAASAPLAPSPEHLAGRWAQVARAGAPLSEWQAASAALGPSLSSPEVLRFSEDGVLLRQAEGAERREQYRLEGTELLRRPEGAGYELRTPLRLYPDRLELGPSAAPDVYAREPAE